MGAEPTLTVGHEEGTNASVHHLFHIPIDNARQLQTQQYALLRHELQILMHNPMCSAKRLSIARHLDHSMLKGGKLRISFSRNGQGE